MPAPPVASTVARAQIVLTSPRAPVEHVGAEARRIAAVLRERQQIDRHVIVEHRDVRVARDGGEQRALDLAAGDVFPVHDAMARVPAFAAEIERARRRRVRAARRCRAGAATMRRPFVARTARRRRDRTARHRRSSVSATCCSKLSSWREHRGDAALRPVRVRVARPLLRDHDDAAVLGGEQREVEARRCPIR